MNFCYTKEIKVDIRSNKRNKGFKSQLQKVFCYTEFLLWGLYFEHNELKDSSKYPSLT